MADCVRELVMQKYSIDLSLKFGLFALNHISHMYALKPRYKIRILI